MCPRNDHEVPHEVPHGHAAKHKANHGVTPRRLGAVARIFAAMLVAPIRFYQRYLSPLKGPTCRFSPTCSEYARQAILRHGPLRGLGLAVWRVLRCQPFTPGGYDPVPD